jgi:hypothetical protein
MFKSGRQFAAWLGLVPRQNSSGGKERLGGVTKAGDRYIRRLLVIGATGLIRYKCKTIPGGLACIVFAQTVRCGFVCTRRSLSVAVADLTGCDNSQPKLRPRSAANRGAASGFCLDRVATAPGKPGDDGERSDHLSAEFACPSLPKPCKPE